MDAPISATIVFNELEQLEFARKAQQPADEDRDIARQSAYHAWFQKIQTIALDEFRQGDNVGKQRRIIAMLRACYEMVVRTYNCVEEVGVTASLVVASYLVSQLSSMLLLRRSLT